MELSYSESDIHRAFQTLESINDVINQLIYWNKDVDSVERYYSSPTGMQLLAANCTLITAIGEGVNRVNRILPDYLQTTFPDVPWRAIVGMRNHIAHGYFELDAELIYDAVRNDIPPLLNVIQSTINHLNEV